MEFNFSITSPTLFLTSIKRQVLDAIVVNILITYAISPFRIAVET